MRSILLAVVAVALSIPAQASVTVSLQGVGSLTTSGTGERSGAEVRWAADFPAYRLIVDRHDSGQVRVTVCRAWADLPTANLAPAEQRTIAVSGDVTYSGAHWFHAHTCPTMVFNRRTPPPIADAKLLPAYDHTRMVPETVLAKVAIGAWPYQRFAGAFGAPHDDWTEDYGRILRSYSGGATALAGTEASPLMPYQVYHLLTGDARAWEAVYSTADASGNFAVHFLSRATDAPLSLAEAHSAPFLQNDVPVRLVTAGGKPLPVPDVAHQQSLVFYAAVVTGERYYRDELHAWTTYNLLTRSRDALRDKGIIWSGEVRASAWGLRALGEAVAVLPAGEAGDLRQQLDANLTYLNAQFAAPGGSMHRDSGLAPSAPLRDSGWTAYFDPTVTGRSAAWNHYVLSWVLDWLDGLDFPAAGVARDHFLKVAAGVTSAAGSVYDWPWAELADKTAAGQVESWPAIEALTFKRRTAPPSTFAAPLTEFYAAWLRAALILRPELGLAKLETAARAHWKDWPPLEWALVRRAQSPCP